ncbi:MAG TPA: glycosyltransferase family 4 protein [bacterium]|nr:glycosyltransferase family 4 protein [bacterium]
MRILVVNWRDSRNPLAGGAEVYFQEIFSRLVRRGHDVTLLSERFAGSSAEEVNEGIRVIRAGGKFTFNFTAGRMVGRLAESLNADVVIDDLNKIPFYSPWHTRRPVLAILMHLFRGSIFRETLPPMAAYVWASETMIPLAYRQCRFAVLSESSKKDTVRVGIDPGRIAVIPPGTDFLRFRPDNSVPRERLVLHVGRLKRYKATDHLLLAAKKLKERGVSFTTVIVGDGDDKPRLEALAAKLGLGEQVRFTGFVPEAEKVSWYRRAAVLVENSVKEGWGLIVMEANACGTPVVAANSPGLRDSSKDGVNGLMYEYGDVPSLAEKLEKLLSDDALRARLGQQGIAWAKQWTWDGAAEAMERVADKAINEGR